MRSPFVNHAGGVRQAPPTTVKAAPPPDVARRLAVCLACSWCLGNRCQHPAQGCAPCKQGRGLAFALALPGFRCPMSKH